MEVSVSFQPSSGIPYSATFHFQGEEIKASMYWSVEPENLYLWVKLLDACKRRKNYVLDTIVPRDERVIMVQGSESKVTFAVTNRSDMGEGCIVIAVDVDKCIPPFEHVIEKLRS